MMMMDLITLVTTQKYKTLTPCTLDFNACVQKNNKDDKKNKRDLTITKILTCYCSKRFEDKLKYATAQKLVRIARTG